MTNELFPQREREKERKTLTSEKSKPKPATCQAVIDAAFEEFKRAYPKRDGGQGWPTVRKHLEAAWKSGEDLEAIVRAAAKFCASLRRDTIGTKYVPMAETWMRKRNWAEFAAEPMQSAMSEFPALPGSSEFESWYAYCCANPHIGSVRELKRQLDRRREEGRAFNFPARWPPPELRLVGAAG
jgi:hypothetical protein